MEEDIKILEEFIKEFNRDYNVRLYVSYNTIQSLENLIARNKKLEKQLEEKEMQHELELIGKEEYIKDAMGEIIEHYYTANEDCILKSKVKEKIEELNQEVKDFEEYWSKDPRRFKRQQCIDYYKLEALQELLD